MSVAAEQPTVASRPENRPQRSKGNRKSDSLSGKEDAKMIGQWRIGRTIGKGSSGRVKIAKHAVTGKYAAIKIVPKGLILHSRMSMTDAGAKADKILLGIEREIVIMKLIDHPNVLNLYDVWETSGELFLIMEYVPGGELFDYLVKRGRLPESEALHYFQQIIHAVDYCHRFNICHRDLKPENLLLDKDKNIKVADFGMAAWQAGERMLETSCGSPHYASPEIVAGKSYNGSASDIWSCGIILFALITGRLPFDDDNIRVLLLKVKTGIFEMPREVKGPVRDLLYRMLEKDPVKRITMPEILVHPFFTSSGATGALEQPLIPPPSLHEVERPVESAGEIDPDIMGNLKTLWHGAADDEIVAALLCKEKTWEKAIYHLLIEYRNKHLENYDAGEDTVRSTLPQSPKRVARTSERAPLQETSHSKTANNQVKLRQEQARPHAPTPTKAQGDKRDMGANLKTSENAIQTGPRLTPQGPRPPMSPRNSERLSTPQPLGVVLDGNMQSSQAPEKRSSAPIPPISRRESIQAPIVDDTEVQRFFQEVAEQLNSLGTTSQSPNQSSGSSAAFANEGDSADSGRFADAEEEEVDLYVPDTPIHEFEAFHVTNPTARGSLDFNMEPEQHISEVSRRTSVRSAGVSSRPRSDLWVEATSAQITETLIPRRPAPPRPVPHVSLPRDASYVYVELDDELGSYDWSESRSTRGVSSINSRWSEASKSSKKALSIRVVPFNTRHGASDVVESPKRSWFQNLFNFKPSPYTFWSYESVSITTRVLHQHLSSLGTRVAIETLADQTVLRCKFARDSLNAADRTTSKSIYFKAEIMHATHSSLYTTGASFTLVKGAQSVFRELCDAVRSNYRLDRQEATR